MLIATIILNKYQQHLFNISTLVFNNILQGTLESFACGTRLFLGIQVPFSSQVRISLLVDIVRFLPWRDRLHVFPVSWNFLTFSKSFHGEYEDFRDGGITLLFPAEKYRKIEVFPSFVISWVKLTNIYLWNIKYTY